MRGRDGYSPLLGCRLLEGGSLSDETEDLRRKARHNVPTSITTHDEQGGGEVNADARCCLIKRDCSWDVRIILRAERVFGVESRLDTPLGTEK